MEEEGEDKNAGEDRKIIWTFFCVPLPELVRPPYGPKFLADGKALERFDSILKSGSMRDLYSHIGLLERKPHTVTATEAMAFNSVCARGGMSAFQRPESYFTRLVYPVHYTTRLFNRDCRASKREFEETIEKFQKDVANVVKKRQLLPFPVCRTDELRKANKGSRISIANIRERTFATDQIDFLATLVGIESQYNITKPVTTIGRRSVYSNPDIDLTSTGNLQISRIHLTISLRADYKFYAEVNGNEALFNGVPVCRGRTVLLNDGDLIDLAGEVFVFFFPTEQFTPDL